MIHLQIDGPPLPPSIGQVVKEGVLNTVIGPSEILVGTPNASKLADLSTATGAQAQIVINNRSTFSIFWSYGTPGTPSALTTGTGDELPSNSFLTLDGIGGLCVWAISGTPQVSGTGTRVTGGFVV